MVDMQQRAMADAVSVFEREAGVVELRDAQPREAAVVTLHMTPDGIPEAIGSAFGEVAGAMTEAGVGLAGPPFTRYLSFGPVIDAEAGFPVMRPAPDVGRVHPGRLPGGRVASIIHVGPYDTLEATYDVLMQRLAATGLRPLGPMWEIYWSDPDAEPDPATWRTEILVPIG
jgi:effector-binding domain-containing protein